MLVDCTWSFLSKWEAFSKIVILLQDSGFKHLHIPTVDFLYAPPTEDLHRGADFIHGELILAFVSNPPSFHSTFCRHFVSVCSGWQSCYAIDRIEVSLMAHKRNGHLNAPEICNTDLYV